MKNSTIPQFHNLQMFIIIVNYRAARMTAEAVASLRKCPEFPDATVVIVDNGSGDGALESLRRDCPDCVVLDAGANLGFSGGNNIGIRYALSHGAKWILLLNNDTLVCSDFIQPLLSAAASDGPTFATPQILTASPSHPLTVKPSNCQTVKPSNPQTIPPPVWYGGGCIDRARGGFYHVTDAKSAATARDVTFASGCCLLVPAEFFAKHGLMDESYFLYYEDAALCLKALAAGYRIRYVPGSVIYHRVSATVGERSPLAEYYGTRNRLLVLSRFKFPWRAFAFVIASRLAKLATAPLHPERRFIALGLVDWLRRSDGMRQFPPQNDNRRRVSFVVNGAFTVRRATGLERFAQEILRALDALVKPGEIILAVPRSTPKDAVPRFSNIETRRCGRFTGPLWEQISLPRFARSLGARTLNLTNTAPLLRPDFACIHDVFYVTHAAQFRRSLRGILSMAWHRIHYRAIARRAELVLTVSNYSASQISSVLGVEPRRIAVLGNGWEHMERIAPDDAIFRRFPEIRRGGYLFALGNKSPYKNLEWCYAAAARFPSTQWVVAGAPLKSAASGDAPLRNVIHTGYVSDAEMKALMLECRALVFPSLDEGFGIPPLEALALRKPAIVARSAGLPEIYASAVHWIADPTRPPASDPTLLLSQPVSPPDAILAAHSWKAAAASLLSVLNVAGHGEVVSEKVRW